VRGLSPLVQLCEKVVKDRGSLLQNVVVPIAKHSETFACEFGVSACIGLRRSVLTAVDLDNEFFFKADKIQNVILKRDPTAKLELLETPISQQLPHRGFRVRWFAPHSLREIADPPRSRSMMRFLRHEPLTRLASRGTLSHKGRGYTELVARA
jgi:hypothetical protein